MSEIITTVAELEELVGKRDVGALVKSIDALDEHCRALLAASPFAVLAAPGASTGPRALLAGSAPGFAAVLDERTLLLPRSQPAPAAGSSAAALFFVPGLGETLRINGRLEAHAHGLVLRVEEAFLHCAKALIRSRLWSRAAAPPAEEQRPQPPPGLAPELHREEVRNFLSRSPFAMLGSLDARGEADLSPKGDPPGFIHVVDDRHLAIPDRPGNRRTDTFHNLLEDSRLELVALVPGDERVLHASGRATLVRDGRLLSEMAVDGKIPKLALLLGVEAMRLETAPAIAASQLWAAPDTAVVERLPPMSAVFAAHVKLNKRKGIAAALSRRLVSPSLIQRGLQKDYRSRLY